MIPHQKKAETVWMCCIIKRGELKVMTVGKAKLSAFDQILKSPTCECKISFIIFIFLSYVQMLSTLFFIYKTLKPTLK